MPRARGAAPEPRRSIPSLDRLLQLPAITELVTRRGRALVRDTARDLLAARRADGAAPDPFDDGAFAAECAARLDALLAPSLRAVFNLTGTVLHTNLGRAVMADAAPQAVTRAMTWPVNLEFDLDGAARGERDSHVERWITRLTGAEAALVVNNNAAAVLSS